MSEIFKPKLYTLIKTGINKQQLVSDIMSGLVVGIVALPLAIAFAVASGVSPEKGLITAIIAGFIVSALGGSRVQIAGPTGAFIVIVFGIIEKYGTSGLIVSTIIAGILLVIFGLLKLGNLLKYFPHPLIVGFTSGIALVIFSTQIKDAIGLNMQKVPADFIEKWKFYFENIKDTNYYALIITIATILITIFFKKISKRIPGSFVAIIVITPIVYFAKLPVPTIETFFGDIPSKIQISLPEINLKDFYYYLSPAITIALLGGIESLLSAVVADGMISGKHRSNTELIAQGIANIVTPLFGGIPATGAIARTATNVKNGGRTPISGIVHALTLLLIMIFLGNFAKLIPLSCLAGILIVVSYNMSEIKSFMLILKGSFFDSLVLVTTFLLTVLIDLTVAIEVGIVLSALLFMKRMSDIADKRIDTFVDTDVIDDYSNLPQGVSIYEISGPLFFASARRYTEIIKEVGLKSKIIIIRMRHVSFIDHTGLHNLTDAVKVLTKMKVQVMFSGVNPDVMKTLENSPIVNLVGKENIFDNFDKALVYAKSKVEQVA